MATYTVIYEGTVREVYSVEAGSEAEAREGWYEGELVISETIDGEVVGVEVDE